MSNDPSSDPNAESQPSKPRSMDEGTETMSGEHSEVQTPRFIPSGLTARGYERTRIRRFQRNQTTAVVSGLAKFGVYTKSDLAGKIEGNKLLRFKATSFLQSCLVGPPKKVGPAQLFRKGDEGLARLLRDLSAAQVVAALSRACDQVAILQDDDEPPPAAPDAEDTGPDTTPQMDPEPQPAEAAGT